MRKCAEYPPSDLKHSTSTCKHIPPPLSFGRLFGILIDNSDCRSNPFGAFPSSGMVITSTVQRPHGAICRLSEGTSVQVTGYAPPSTHTVGGPEDRLRHDMYSLVQYATIPPPTPATQQHIATFIIRLDIVRLSGTHQPSNYEIWGDPCRFPASAGCPGRSALPALRRAESRSPAVCRLLWPWLTPLDLRHSHQPSAAPMPN